MLKALAFERISIKKKQIATCILQNSKLQFFQYSVKITFSDNEATFANENVINEPTSSDEEVGNESESSDEELICAVCDRCFSSAKQLAKHQMDKKHFSCSVCEAIFTSLLALEEHKENLEHWSEDEEAAFANPRALDVDIETQIKDIERLL